MMKSEIESPLDSSLQLAHSDPEKLNKFLAPTVSPLPALRSNTESSKDKSGSATNY